MVIITWNANGIAQHKIELLNFLTMHKIDIACIQETRLKPDKNFSLPGFKELSKDRLKMGGGVALIIRDQIAFLDLKVNMPEDETETVGITVEIDNKTSVGQKQAHSDRRRL
jgi:exonuclease III